MASSLSDSHVILATMDGAGKKKRQLWELKRLLRSAYGRATEPLFPPCVVREASAPWVFPHFHTQTTSSHQRCLLTPHSWLYLGLNIRSLKKREKPNKTSSTAGLPLECMFVLQGDLPRLLEANVNQLNRDYWRAKAVLIVPDWQPTVTWLGRKRWTQKVSHGSHTWETFRWR